MNLASHIKRILDSGAVDSLKIEGEQNLHIMQLLQLKLTEKLLMIIMKENLSLKISKRVTYYKKIEVSQMHI